MGLARPFRPLRWTTAVAILAMALLFWTARGSQDTSPATVPLRLIVVNSAAAAQKLRDQLGHGADFAVLARENSVDATSLDGGFLGNVDPTSLRAELRDALHNVEPGQISAVFKLP